MKATFCSLLLAARQVKWREKLNLKTREKSWHTAKTIPAHLAFLCMLSQRRQNENKNGRPSPGFTCTQTGLPTEYFALCSEHFEASCFSRCVLIGTPVDFKRFYLEECSVPSIYAKPKDSLRFTKQ